MAKIEQTQLQQMNYCIEEDEIDLRELFAIIKKYTKQIFAFVFIVTLIVVIILILTPNSYKSEVILAPQGKQKSVGGGLASLAAFAGVNIGGGSDGMDPFTLMETTLKDPVFLNQVIKKYSLIDKLTHLKHLVYPFGLTFENKIDDLKDKSLDEKLYIIRKKLEEDILSISSDKKTNLITLSATCKDRFLSKELVDIFLKEITSYRKLKDMKDIERQIHYYKKELAQTTDVSLKEQLSKSLSGLMQKRVFSHANEYYFVSKITDPRVPYIKEKVKPKRGLIVVVAFITSFILAIFGVFFWEFIKNGKEDEKK